MTVPSEQSRIQYTTDGTSVSFPVPFRFLNAAHLQVARQHNDEPSILELGVDYSVSGVGNQAGGTITTTTTLPAGDSISIERVVPITQETAYQRNDPFPERAHEQALDKLTMICQMLGSILGVTPGSMNRALLLGAADINGSGSYRANGNRISNLGSPKVTTDAARLQDIIERLSGLAADGSGQFVVERLADSADPTNGANMVSIFGGGTVAEALYFVTPEMFGAKGDGVSNDTSAVQEALNTGKPIHSSSGRKYLVDGLVFNGNPSILGLKLILSDTSHVDCLKILNSTTGFIYDCDFYVNKGAHIGHDVCAFSLDNSKRVSIHASKFTGGTNTTYIGHAGAATLLVKDSEFVKISDCYVDDGEKENLAIINSTYCTVHNTTARGSGYSNITTVLGSHHTISASTSIDSGTSGISVNSKFSIVTGCIADGTRDPFSNGINMGHPGIYSADNSVVMGCVVSGAVAAGIAVTGSKNLSISGCVIYSLENKETQNGILAANSAGGVTISNNRIVGDYTGNAIRYFDVSGLMGNVIISSNTLDGSTTLSNVVVQGAKSAQIISNSLKDPNNSDENNFSSHVEIALCNEIKIEENILKSENHAPKYSIRLPASTSFTRGSIKNNFSRGYKEDFLELSSSLIDSIGVSGNDISDDPLVFIVTPIPGTFSTTVKNKNIIKGACMPYVIPSNAQSRDVNIAINQILNGSFTILHGPITEGASFRVAIT